MVGPGATYAQMITGDFIPSRGAPAEAEAGAAPTGMF
jgi:acetolactate synthase-1/2/3 large subunit